MTQAGCEYSYLDGVYVLGALGARERAEYERHLPDCPACSAGLRDLAGLPGLLGRVDPDAVEQLPPVEPLPDTLLPAVLARARRSQGRRRTVVASIVAAAAVLIALVGVGIGTTLRDSGPELTSAQRMESTGTASSGWVSFTERPWGTRIDLTCTYEGPVSGAASYVLVVTSTDGHSEQAGTWRTAPGREIEVTMATSIPPDDIASAVVRTASGYPVLRLEE
ncbi:anti-sigma factor family protein [Nocardioides sp. GXZ039]|uniref:anti-sigma factor family protein n=1 Tax=Nocardioides sp. GXZ039 TaxID=3136018 RepID=UPI0030F3FAF1